MKSSPFIGGGSWLPERSWSFALMLVVLAVVVLLLSACSPRQMIVRSMADELAAQGRSAEDDLDLAREASAFYLKLSESVLRSDPGHLALAEAVAGGFTQYAYAFVSFEADRQEALDARGAQQLRERAARLYRRAQRHGLAGLESAIPGFMAALARPGANDWPRLRRDQVGVAYWAAAAWGGAISLSKDDPEAIADLPLAVRLATLAWATDPEYGHGALASLMGTFEAARPGGNRLQALAYFDRGLAIAQGTSVGAFVAKAEGYALSGGDRALFEALLREALAVREDAGSPLALQNEVMRRRAQWLMARAADLF